LLLQLTIHVYVRKTKCGHCNWIWKLVFFCHASVSHLCKKKPYYLNWWICLMCLYLPCIAGCFDLLHKEFTLLKTEDDFPVMLELWILLLHLQFKLHFGIHKWHFLSIEMQTADLALLSQRPRQLWRKKSILTNNSRLYIYNQLVVLFFHDRCTNFK
jgi:hypothetical protein